MIGKLVSGVILFVMVWALKFGCNMVGFEPIDDAEWIAEENAWVAEEIASGQTQPARAWVQGENRATFEAPIEDLKSLVEEFHAAGAEQVLVGGLEEWEGVHFAGYLVVPLPEATAERAPIFAVEASHWEGEGTQDLAQPYLVVPLD